MGEKLDEDGCGLSLSLSLFRCPPEEVLGQTVVKPVATTFSEFHADEGVEDAAGKKLRLSKEQATVLEDMFKDLITPTMKQKVGLAKQLKLRPRQVEVWFQNRRARTKLKKSEEDYEHLKSYRKVLKDKNKQLHKQVKELRGELKLICTTTTEHDINSPTTLIMCPSCQRITPVVPNRSSNYQL